MVFEIFLSGQDRACFLQIHHSSSSDGVRSSDFHRIQILSEPFAWDWEFQVRNVQFWRNIAEMVHSLVIRTMNLLTIDARKKRPKMLFSWKEFFLSVRIDLKNVCFKGETLNTSRFLNLVVTIRYAFSGPKTVLFSKSRWKKDQNWFFHEKKNFERQNRSKERMFQRRNSEHL